MTTNNQKELAQALRNLAGIIEKFTKLPKEKQLQIIDELMEE